MSLRATLRVVLHQVQSPDNVGSVARAMANFGATGLWLAEPETTELADARRLAVHAEHVLDTMKIAGSLGEALAPCVYVLGTSSRRELARRPSLDAEEGVRRLRAAAARGPVALLLGGERRGLSDAELALCHDVAVIPTGARQPSMNLGAAAAVLLYLVARADGAEQVEPAQSPGAPRELVDLLRERMRRALLAADALNAQNPEPVLDEMLRALERGGLARREAELWAAAFKQLARAVTGERPR
ncbi:MAG TPA: RNA methyltransferase [Myxococcaceae bacterium]|jgi:tRNA/rRNA methyltransferase|nr:RNA methyltransferase [Myxococcaceae bacterium]